MKQEIITRFTELLKTEFSPELDKELKELGKKFNDARKELRAKELATFLENEENQKEDFEPTVDPLDESFDDLYKEYREIKIQKQEERAAEERENLKQKKSILASVAEITDNEEHIGKAFEQFKELQSKWEAIGRVPGDVHQEILSAYHQAVEKFYYDIKIYRELREFDLKKNLETKKEIITKIQALDLDGDLKEVDMSIKQLQKEWFEVGPVSRELYDGLKAEFTKAADTVYEKLKAHFEVLKAERASNLETKKALLEQLGQIKFSANKNHKEWMASTDKVKEIQEKWKTIGPGPRKENEEVWAELRSVCDTFFEAKQAFYDVEKGKQDNNKKLKEALIVKANALKDDTDWKETSQKLIRLQADWKKVGPARQKDEQVLWKNFREACNSFFDAKTAHFSKMDEEFSGNLKNKEALLAEIEGLKTGGEKDAVIQKLNEFTKKWNQLGRIPRKDMDRIQGAYQKAMDVHYDSLGISAEELEHSKFMARLESFEGADNVEDLVANERRFIAEKVSALSETLGKFENNLSFFGGGSKSPLFKEAEQKVKQVERQLESWKQKQILLKKATKA